MIAQFEALAHIPDDLSPVEAAPLMCAGITTFNSRELKDELAADHFCLRSFFATESAFLAVLFSFNLLSEFSYTGLR
jgi:hypothetical protein